MTDEDLTQIKVDIGVVKSQMEGISTDIAELREDIKKANSNNVTRNEWQQRNQEVDSRFSSMGREISEVKGDVKAQRIPVTAVVAMIISSLALGWQVVGPALTGAIK